MAKGLTSRREYACILNDKIQTPTTTAAAEWPRKLVFESSDVEEVGRQTWAKQLLSMYTDESSLTPQDFEQKFLERLPADWVVCSVSLDIERDDLYVSRVQRHCTPVVLRLPLKRQANRDG